MDRGGELAGVGIAAQDDERVRGLVAEQEPAAGGVEGEETGVLAAVGGVLFEVERAGFAVDGEDGDGVAGDAVGDVEEAAVGGDLDLAGEGGVWGEVWFKGGDEGALRRGGW
jgi:hypothetical protein